MPKAYPSSTQAPPGATGLDAMYAENGDRLTYDQIDWSKVNKKEIDALVSSMHSATREASIIIAETASYLVPVGPALGLGGKLLTRGLRPVATRIASINLVRVGVKTLLKSAQLPAKGGLTAVGRALQKHGSRAGSKFPKAKGKGPQINAQALQILKDIITHPNVVKVKRHHARFGHVLEFKAPGGVGARYTADGKKFIGFIEH